MPALRNQRQELFAHALAQGKTADKAYENAGYRRNRHNASRLKTNETIIARVLELQAEKQDRFVLTRQRLLDALLENLEKALGRRPVKIGEEGKEVYVYRGDVANNALKMAGSELGLFTDKSGVTHRPSHYDDLSDADLVRKLRDEAQVLLEYHNQCEHGENEAE